MAVSKLDSARRQIDSAIRMLFNEFDPIAIMSVTHAAYLVLHDLAERAGDVESHNYIRSRIRPGKTSQFWNAVRSTPNFFKHADRDPKATIDEPSIQDVEGRILWACMYYLGIEKSMTKPMAAFVSIIVCLHPELSASEWPSAEFIASDLSANVRKMSRTELMDFGRSLLDTRAT